MKVERGKKPVTKSATPFLRAFVLAVSSFLFLNNILHRMEAGGRRIRRGSQFLIVGSRGRF